MKPRGAATVQRSEYAPPAYLVDRVNLEFELGFPTRVTAELEFRRNGLEQAFVLNGSGLTLLDVRLDGARLSSDAYLLTPDSLTLKAPPAHGTLLIVTELMPAGGGLEGLITLGDALVTHCEPEGFRRITYFPDRPDIMAIYTCSLIGARTDYPVLLSNGQLVDAGMMPDGKHFAKWHDPFPKPSSMFALAAGTMEVIRDQYVTRAGRQVALAVYAQADDIEYCAVGLEALKRAMRWDEEHYDREYDLDTLNTVVMRSYPGGAMENKGLNLYAPEFFLASPEISTDKSMHFVCGIIAHEYLHNWTGNRVGLRDWFQLSLKEGFTILRNQDFWATEIGDDAARIDDVARLIERQFPEDAGAMAHPVRPAAYEVVSNLYTNTVYLKGAEVIRMMRTIIGDDLFARAANEFFRTCDGQAATIDDLVDSIERVGGVDLGQFRAWYDVPGPVGLEASGIHDPASATFTLALQQNIEGGPLHIPLRLGLTDLKGRAVPLRCDGEDHGTTMLFQLRTERAEIVFTDVPERPVPAILRGFSAPVHLTSHFAAHDLQVLAEHDCDAVTRWMAAQELGVRAVQGQPGALEIFTSIVGETAVPGADPAIAARIAQMPSLRQILSQGDGGDIGALHAARKACAAHIGTQLRDALWSTRNAVKPETAGARRLRNLCLWYLTRDPAPEHIQALWAQLDNPLANEALAALHMLIDLGGEHRVRALQESYARWRGVPQLLDQWFAAQAACDATDGAQLAASIADHPDFDLRNTTRLKAIFDTFGANLGALHDISGQGYMFVANVAHRLCRENPRFAVRLLRHLFSEWSRLDKPRRDLMRRAVEPIATDQALPPEVAEVLGKYLDASS